MNLKFGCATPEVTRIIQQLQTTKSIVFKKIILHDINEMISSEEVLLRFIKVKGHLEVLKCIKNDSLFEVVSTILRTCCLKNVKIGRQLYRNELFEKLVEMNKLNTLCLTHIALIGLATVHNAEAQESVRQMGLLVVMMQSLEEALERDEPTKKIQIVTLSLASAVTNPINVLNQGVVGAIIPMILATIEKKHWCFLLSLLRYLLYKNKENQELFVQSGGIQVIFKEVIDSANSVEDAANKRSLRVTGVVTVLRKHKVVQKLLTQKEYLDALVVLLHKLNATVHGVANIHRIFQELIQIPGISTKTIYRLKRLLDKETPVPSETVKHRKLDPEVARAQYRIMSTRLSQQLPVLKIKTRTKVLQTPVWHPTTLLEVRTPKPAAFSLLRAALTTPASIISSTLNRLPFFKKSNR